jgi:hypothetical protein
MKWRDIIAFGAMAALVFWAFDELQEPVDKEPTPLVMAQQHCRPLFPAPKDWWRYPVCVREMHAKLKDGTADTGK